MQRKESKDSQRILRKESKDIFKDTKRILQKKRVQGYLQGSSKDATKRVQGYLQGSSKDTTKKVQGYLQGFSKDTTKTLQVLGVASWYRWFVPVFAKIVKSLNDLLRKGNKWVWTQNIRRRSKR